MKVLWATSHVPDPARGGGAAYEYELLRMATARHEVTLLTAGEQGKPIPTAVSDLPVKIERVTWELPPRPRHRLAMLWRSIRHPMGMAGAGNRRCAAALAAGVGRAEAADRYDLVQVWPGEMAEVTRAAQAPTALFCTDVHTRQRQRDLAFAPSRRRRLLAALELRKVRQWERRAYLHANALASVTEIDAAALRELTGRQADVIPIVLGDEWFVPRAAEPEPALVTMVSALDYKPNVDAVIWFVEEIWPKVRAERPDATLHVVGRQPIDAVKDAVAGAPGATLLADVPDILPHYWTAAAVVAPTRLGSGMRNKILHAAACGAPQVVTSTAIEGIGLDAGTDVLVADDADGFARAVIATLADPAAAKARAASAAAFVERFRTTNVAAAFEQHWQRAAAGRTG